MYVKPQVCKKELGQRDFSAKQLQKNEKLKSVETEETSIQEGAKKPEKEETESMKIQSKRETEKMSLPRSYASVLMSIPSISKGENRGTSKVSNFKILSWNRGNNSRNQEGVLRSDSLSKTCI